MRKNIKLLGAIAVAGVVATTGSAFTAGGLVDNAAVEAQVGGTVGQTVVGATLSSTKYTADADGNVSNVELTFGTALKSGSSASIKIDAETAARSCTVTTTTTTYNCPVTTAVPVTTLNVTVKGADQV